MNAGSRNACEEIIRNSRQRPTHPLFALSARDIVERTQFAMGFTQPRRIAARTIAERVAGRVRAHPHTHDVNFDWGDRVLALHANSYLWDAVWGYESERWEHLLIVTLSSLRRKLGRYGQMIRTIYGVGYALREN